MIRHTLAALLFTSGFAFAAQAEDYVLVLKDHQFSPTEITLPADQKIQLTVKNEQGKPAEFESEDLDREKVVAANSEIVVNLGPLKPGTYSFVDDFNRESTGKIIVK